MPGKSPLNFKNPILKELQKLSTVDIWNDVVRKPISDDKIKLAQKKIHELYPIQEIPVSKLFSNNPLANCFKKKKNAQEHQAFLKHQMKFPSELKG